MFSLSRGRDELRVPLRVLVGGAVDGYGGAEHVLRIASRRRPLLEHLYDGFLQHLLILAAVVVEGVLTDPAPDQTLVLRVIQINDQGADHILLRGDAAHAAANPAHAPRTVGSLLFHPAADGN